jgi:hypothetical protein
MALGVVAVLPLPAAATPITTVINLDTVFTGYNPDGVAPWLTAQFTSSVGSNTGTLVLSSNTSGLDFVQGLPNTRATVGWAFYLAQGVSGLNCTAGKCASNGALYGAGGFNTGSVPGMFNLAFGWSSQSRFLGGDTATYDLTFSNPLTGNPFAENGSNWSSVAHVQGLAAGCDSTWIVSGDGSGAAGSGPCIDHTRVDVPEPGELGVFGLGLLFAGLFLGLRRRNV